MSTIHIDERDGVAVLRLDRPKVNALDTDTIEALEAIVRERAADGAAGFVLTGAGKCFSAGLDTRLVADFDAAQRQEMIRAINAMYRTLYATPVPLVTAVNGHALAGGFVFVLCGDVAVATEADCHLGLAEVRAGVPFPAVPLRLAQAELDPSVARSLALTGRNLSPREALDLRVVDEIAPAATLVDRAVQIATELAALPAYATIKGQVRERVIADLDAVIASDSDPMLENWV